MKPNEVVVQTALSQVGYSASSGKKNKYAQELDKIGFVYNYPKNGFDWCDIFVDWCFITTFGVENAIKMLYQPKKGTGAGCEFSAQFFRSNNAWGRVPQIGRQIFFGTKGAESHTGIVVGFDKQFVYTVEGNTGGGNGAVNRRTYPINSERIVGYGIPKWSIVDPTPVPTKSDVQVAKECIEGKWGNGEIRIQKLKAQGYSPVKVQSIINLVLRPKQSDKQIAVEVVAGKWSNGAERKELLKLAGYDYNKVQNLVNTMLGG